MAETMRSDESLVHGLAHDAQVILRIAVLAGVAATILVMMTFWFWAIVPGAFLFVAYVLLLATNLIERRTTHRQAEVVNDAAHTLPVSRPLDDATLMPQQQKVEKVIHHRLTWIGVEVAVAAALLALLLASLVLEWEIVALGALILFAYIVLVSTPVWLGWMEDDVIETERAAEKDAEGVGG